MEQKIDPQDLPSLFDGEVFQPLPESVLDLLPNYVVRAYQDVADSYSDLLVAEADVAQRERDLKETVTALREFERKVASLPKPSRIDLVREMAYTHRTYG
jgi:hypothetical protein